MSRRIARRRQQSMNARRRRRGYFLCFVPDWFAPPTRPPHRVIHANPDTFPWYRGLGAGPVFRRMDGSAIGPAEVARHALSGGTMMVRWETVEVHPNELEVVATEIPEAEWRLPVE